MPCACRCGGCGECVDRNDEAAAIAAFARLASGATGWLPASWMVDHALQNVLDRSVDPEDVTLWVTVPLFLEGAHDG